MGEKEREKEDRVKREEGWGARSRSKRGWEDEHAGRNMQMMYVGDTGRREG